MHEVGCRQSCRLRSFLARVVQTVLDLLDVEVMGWPVVIGALMVWMLVLRCWGKCRGFA